MHLSKIQYLELQNITRLQDKDASCGAMFSKLDLQRVTSEFESHCVPHS